MQNTYEANISRDRPGCILFLLDMSASMSEEFGFGISRADFLSDALNRALTELAVACRRPDGVRHFFDVGLVEYGTRVRPAFAGALVGKSLTSITELAENPLEVPKRMRKEPDGAGGVVEVEVPFPIFYTANPDGATPMCAGLRHATAIVNTWCKSHTSSFPPVVLHITDGEATDGGPEEVEAAARRLTDLHTMDGQVLLLNLHIAGRESPVRFPGAEEDLPRHPFARALFRSSSVLPPLLLARCFKRGMNVQPGSRAYIYNGAMEDVVSMFDIGTKAAADRTAVVPVNR